MIALQGCTEVADQTKRRAHAMKMLVKITQSANSQFRAWCPSLPGCRAAAESREEAMWAIEKAIRAYLASMNVSEPAHLEPTCCDS